MATEQINTYDPADNSPEALMDTVDEQRTGYVALSLTNYTTTTVPAIAIGSEIEINGALFKTLDSTDPVTVGGVADGVVYILATPSGVSPAQIVTFSFTATAPTWFDSKQGYYNAGGTARYVDFKMDKSGTSYSDKRQFVTPQNRDIATTGTGELITDEEIKANSTIRADEGVSTDQGVIYIKNEVLPFTGWDMDTNATFNVAHGLSDHTKIKGISGHIIPAGAYVPFGNSSLAGVPTVFLAGFDATNIILGRTSGGLYDGPSFTSVPGVVYVNYQT